MMGDRYLHNFLYIPCFVFDAADEDGNGTLSIIECICILPKLEDAFLAAREHVLRQEAEPTSTEIVSGMGSAISFIEKTIMNIKSATEMQTKIAEDNEQDNLVNNDLRQLDDFNFIPTLDFM